MTLEIINVLSCSLLGIDKEAVYKTKFHITLKEYQLFGKQTKFEIVSCKTCRFNPDNENYQAGGDCHDCNQYSEWMQLKHVLENKCKECFYENDPCHYICVECQDARNFITRPTLMEEITHKIKKREKKLKLLKNKLRALKNKEGDKNL